MGFPILFLFLWGDAYRRGFFCGDDDIIHPYHESTVPSIYLYIFGLGMTTVVVSNAPTLLIYDAQRGVYVTNDPFKKYLGIREGGNMQNGFDSARR